MATGKCGRPVGATRAECARRFDAGLGVGQIARALGLTRQAVSQQLLAAGRDPAGRFGGAVRAGRERFRDAWNAAPDLAAAAAALGLTERRARDRASALRRLGLALKRLPVRPPGPRAAPVAARVLALARRGLSRAEIARRSGADERYVSKLLSGAKAPRSLT
jgi:DNA-binding CsgD family transcriptional regulator